MSNARAFRRRRRKVSRAVADEVTALTCAVRGCTCEPDIQTRHTDYGTERRILHDDDCPAANTGTSYAIVPGPHTTAEGLAEAVRFLTDEVER